MSATDRQCDRLAQLVSIETPSADAAHLEQGHRLLFPWIEEALGRGAKVVTEEGVPHLLVEPVAPEGVLLLCHLDTVFPLGTIDRRPFRIEDGRAYGPGVFDMKAGVVAAIEAVAVLPAEVDRSRIGLLITGDEEIGSRTSLAVIERTVRDVGAVLITEPSLDGALKTGRKGAAFYDLLFRGVAAHAGLEPELGRNALLEMARWSSRIGELADSSHGTSVTPTLASAGTAQNVVPDQARLTVDVRATSTAELERVDRAIADWIGASGEEGTSVELYAGGINRPPLETAMAVGLADLCRREAVRLGQSDPGVVTVGGASDGNFTSAMGVPTLDGLGPRGDGAHAEHEWVDIDSLGERVELIAAILEAVLRDGVPH